MRNGCCPRSAASGHISVRGGICCRPLDGATIWPSASPSGTRSPGLPRPPPERELGQGFPPEPTHNTRTISPPINLTVPLLMSWLNATLPDVAAQLAPEDLLAWAHEGCQGAIRQLRFRSLSAVGRGGTRTPFRLARRPIRRALWQAPATRCPSPQRRGRRAVCLRTPPVATPCLLGWRRRSS